MQNRTKKLTTEWFKKAENDLSFAKASYEEFDDFYSQMCILCHDAAEKYLKAFIVSTGKRTEPIHDLLRLLNECKKIDPSFEDFVEKLRILNRYYTPLKYPSHYPMLTKDQTKEALEITEELQKFISKYIFDKF